MKPCRVIQEGWLQKKGEYIKNWRNRYFILREDGQFYGYKAKPISETELANPLNNFTVEGCQIMKMDRPKSNCFVVRGLQMTNVVERTFCADSTQARQTWIEAIDKVKSSLIEQRDKENEGSKDEVKTAKKSFENFDFIKVLGRGTFGKVVLCREKASSTLYAIKILKKQVIISKGEVEHTMTENKVLQTAKHPFIVGLKYSFTTQDRLCFVMEYVNGGELFVHLRNERAFTEERARFYSAEITSAIGYLHGRGIVYRDIKLENLLLDRDGHIKIADFGLCKENLNADDTTSTFCGTPEYLAPEIIEDSDYGLAVDWWGVGCVTYEMLCGKLPFYSRDQSLLFDLILGGQLKFPPGLNATARSLLAGLLTKEPSKRLGSGVNGSQDVKNHEFFASISWADLEKKRLKPPFKPQVSSDLDTRYFDSEFTGQSVQLTPPDGFQAGLTNIMEEGEEGATKFHRFSFNNSASASSSKGHLDK